MLKEILLNAGLDMAIVYSNYATWHIMKAEDEKSMVLTLSKVFRSRLPRIAVQETLKKANGTFQQPMGSIDC